MVVLEPDQAKPVSWYLVGLEYARGVLKFSAPWKGIATPAPRDRNDSGGQNEGAEEQLLSRWAGICVRRFEVLCAVEGDCYSRSAGSQ